MSVEYGIVTIGTLSTSTANYEAGYIFTANKTLKFHGFRVYPYAATSNITCRLWDVASKTQIASVPLVSTTVQAWNEVYLDAPVKLEKGKSYAISYYSSPTRYRQTIATAEFNPLITLVSGCYVGSSRSYPGNTDTTYTHQLIDCIISVANPGKYLIRSGSTLYTITDGTITALAETEITASLFQTYGVDDVPDGTLLLGLTDPEVLYWHDSTDDPPELTLTVTGSPPVPQIVITSTQDMSDPSILGIESATVDASDDVLFAISFDDGVNWKAYDGGKWVTLSTENSGMTKTTMENISLESWAEVAMSAMYKLRFVLMDTDSYVSAVRVNYIN